jgi:hypothetical protein
LDSQKALKDGRSLSLPGLITETFFSISRSLFQNAWSGTLRVISWDFFGEDLKGRLEQRLDMNMKHEVGSGLTILFVQLALILAYEGNYSIRPVKTAKYPLNGHLILSPLEEK